MMSETIKLVMVKRNMTGKDLAEALGCSSQNIYALLKKIIGAKNSFARLQKN